MQTLVPLLSTLLAAWPRDAQGAAARFVGVPLGESALDAIESEEVRRHFGDNAAGMDARVRVDMALAPVHRQLAASGGRALAEGPGSPLQRLLVNPARDMPGEAWFAQLMATVAAAEHALGLFCSALYLLPLPWHAPPPLVAAVAVFSLQALPHGCSLPAEAPAFAFVFGVQPAGAPPSPEILVRHYAESETERAQRLALERVSILALSREQREHQKRLETQWQPWEAAGPLRYLAAAWVDPVLYMEARKHATGSWLTPDPAPPVR